MLNNLTLAGSIQEREGNISFGIGMNWGEEYSGTEFYQLYMDLFIWKFAFTIIKVY